MIEDSFSLCVHFFLGIFWIPVAPFLPHRHYWIYRSFLDSFISFLIPYLSIILFLTASSCLPLLRMNLSMLADLDLRNGLSCEHRFIDHTAATKQQHITWTALKKGRKERTNGTRRKERRKEGTKEQEESDRIDGRKRDSQPTREERREESNRARSDRFVQWYFIPRSVLRVFTLMHVQHVHHIWRKMRSRIEVCADPVADESQPPILPRMS